MKLNLAFSTCPNDTFIFDALVNKKIPANLDFDVTMADVEVLNNKAFAEQADITKISFNAYAHVSQNYKILNAGSALGNNCGPLLISKKQYNLDEVKDLRIAIPGKNTTANLLLGIAFPEAQNKIPMLFSDIENAILSNEVDAGLIIHENRFTYEKKGLKKIIDLGEYWETETQNPIPLGCIAIHRRIPEQIQKMVDGLIRQSIEFAFQNPESSKDYIKKHAQDVDDIVIQQHINLYVNNYSIDLGEKGKNAIKTLFARAKHIPNFPIIAQNCFV